MAEVEQPLSFNVSDKLKHLAIIMDGNGRWAQGRGLARTVGHKQGANTVIEITTEAKKLGIEYLTLFGFSSENWQRPEDEVSDLMGLLSLYLSRETKKLIAENVRLRIIGDRAMFSKPLQNAIAKSETQTAHCTGPTLVLALSYGGRQEIVFALQDIAKKVQDGELDPTEINAELLGANLESSDIPEPDLILRTSGEKRISNFLLWQAAYAELAFTDTLWPDFTGSELRNIVKEFCTRDRRYGKVS